MKAPPHYGHISIRSSALQVSMEDRLKCLHSLRNRGDAICAVKWCASVAISSQTSIKAEDEESDQEDTNLMIKGETVTKPISVPFCPIAMLSM
jgi:hypothetical protein